MRHSLSYAGAVVAATLAAAGAAAQPPRGPNLPPAFSPYLNLARPGADAAVNYYGIVRPQVQATAAIQALQAGPLLPNPFAGGANAADQPAVTGNPFGFQNSRLYFQNQYLGGGIGYNQANKPAASGPASGPGPGAGPRHRGPCPAPLGSYFARGPNLPHRSFQRNPSDCVRVFSGCPLPDHGGPSFGRTPRASPSSTPRNPTGREISAENTRTFAQKKF